MKLHTRGRHMAFAAALALGACATTPPPPAQNPSPASIPAPAATTGTAARKEPQAYGNYLRVVRGGQTLYCQKDSDTNTRMVHETCLTPAQARAQEEEARRFMQGAQGISNTPASANVR